MDTGEHNVAYPETQSRATEELRDALPRPRRLPDDDSSPMQIEFYRRMTPGRRLEVAEQLCWSARRLKGAGLRAQQPDWTDQQIESAVTQIFLHARS